MARVNARFFLTKKLAGTFFRAEDLDPAELPVLIPVEIEEEDYVDLVTAKGCKAVGLPTTYPTDDAGNPVDHGTCQLIGLKAWRDEEEGIACRSSLHDSPTDGEELAYFDRPVRQLTPSGPTETFGEWYGMFDW